MKELEVGVSCQDELKGYLEVMGKLPWPRSLSKRARWKTWVDLVVALEVKVKVKPLKSPGILGTLRNREFPQGAPECCKVAQVVVQEQGPWRGRCLFLRGEQIA